MTISKRVKIILCIFISLALSFAIKKYLFIADTPYINKNFLVVASQKLSVSINNAIHHSRTTQLSPTPASTSQIEFYKKAAPSLKTPSISPTLPSQNKSHSTTPTIQNSPTPSPRRIPTQSGEGGPTSTPTPTLSFKSKLGINIISTYSNGAKKIIVAKPKIIKVMDPQNHGSLLQAVNDFKTANSQGIVILRFYIQNKKYSLSDNPEASAQDLFNTVISPNLKKLINDLNKFDYLETPNEIDTTPGWETVESVTWLGKFWTKLTELNTSFGIKTCIASLPVGNPSGEYEELKNKLSAFSLALTKARQTNSAFCYHAYTLKYATDSDEYYYSLRHRLLHKIIVEINGNYSNIPFILSESGVDRAGDPKHDGWQERGSEQDFENWLGWFDKELNKDNYVIGSALFQIGDGNWSSFNLEPIADWLANYIKK